MNELLHSAMPCKVIPLAQVIRHLEDAGEVNVTLAEHNATKCENGSITYQVKHDVAFVLDPLSNKKRKKAWLFSNSCDPHIVLPQDFPTHCPDLCQISAITFGAQAAFQKLRASKNVDILWRMRLVISCCSQYSPLEMTGFTFCFLILQQCNKRKERCMFFNK